MFLLKYTTIKPGEQADRFKKLSYLHVFVSSTLMILKISHEYQSYLQRYWRIRWFLKKSIFWAQVCLKHSVMSQVCLEHFFVSQVCLELPIVSQVCLRLDCYTNCWAFRTMLFLSHHLILFLPRHNAELNILLSHSGWDLLAGPLISFSYESLVIIK